MRFIVCVWLILAAGPPADAITVRLSANGESAAAPQTVTLRARSAADAAEPVVRRLSVPGDARIDLPEGLWEITVDAPGFWAPRKIVPAGAEVTFELQRAATLRGTLAKTTPPATDLRVSFGTGESSCAIDGAEWTCSVPAGVYDLRFSSAGHAAIHRWGVRAAPGAVVALGALSFVRGAALSGFVAAERGVNADLSEVRVVAAPRAGGEKPLRTRPRRTAADFFRSAASRRASTSFPRPARRRARREPPSAS